MPQEVVHRKHQSVAIVLKHLERLFKPSAKTRRCNKDGQVQIRLGLKVWKRCLARECSLVCLRGFLETPKSLEGDCAIDVRLCVIEVVGKREIAIEEFQRDLRNGGG